MTSSKDHSDVSPNNIIEPTMETLSAEEQHEFEEYMEQLIKEAKAKYLSNFKADKNQKFIRIRETNLTSLRLAATILMYVT
jgi:hypothetical protein